MTGQPHDLLFQMAHAREGPSGDREESDEPTVTVAAGGDAPARLDATPLLPMCSVWDSAPRAHCLDSTHDPLSADGASALRRLSSLRIATCLHHARARRHAVLFLSNVPACVGHTPRAVESSLLHEESLVSAAWILLAIGIAGAVVMLATSGARRYQ